MEFLTFNRFISLDALIIFYYIGVFALPFFTWFSIKKIMTNIDGTKTILQKGTHALWQSLNSKQKITRVLLIIISFLLMQIIWRIIFEFLIAFMQIHQQIVQSSSFAL